MKQNTFSILDVFAEEKYAGNQLAVVKVENPLTDAEMQQFAREMNFSETTFILSDTAEKGGYPVRIFTPANEVPFAGHPTLGTAYVIQKEIVRRPVGEVILNLKAGQIPVTISYDGDRAVKLVMKQLEPVFGKIMYPKEIAPVLNISPQDIDSRFPTQEVSTGLPFIMVPLKTLAAVKKAKIDKEKYFALIENSEAKAVFIFCPETYKQENQLNARMFADSYGIPEDPATGSANGCLAGYLVKHRYFGSSTINIKVEQGYEINRPSLLFLEAEEKDKRIEIYVGGSVKEVARGILL